MHKTAYVFFCVGAESEKRAGINDTFVQIWVIFLKSGILAKMITIQRAQALLGVELARKILTIRYLTLRGRVQQIMPFLHTFDAQCYVVGS